MNISSLYLKWKPKKFKDIVGQNTILEYIKNSIISNNLHHSYIFIGLRGIGKTTLARLFVKSINCLNIKKNLDNYDFPCNLCKSCISIDNNNFVDFIEIDGSIKTGVDDIKEIISNIYYLPINSKYKIYLIDEIHMLSKHSFNSLLKSLEEPPLHIKFILLTTEIKKIPDTILSRCIILNFNKISDFYIVKRLKYILDNEKIKYKDNVLYMISRFSNGSLRDAINILEQSILLNKNLLNNKCIVNILKICENNIIINIIKSILYNNKNLFIYTINYIDKSNINYKNILYQILNILHAIFMLNLDKNYIINPCLYDNLNEILELSNNSNILNLKKIYKIFIKMNNDINIINNNELYFNMYILYVYYDINFNSE